MTKFHYARVNENNEVVLPARVAEELGIVPGDELRVEPNGHGIYVHSPVNALKRVYVEATNKCNLNCSTCMRNVWDVKFGYMAGETFGRILANLQDLPNKPELFFCGYGEPLSHPHILDMIQRARELGHRVSLITNGIPLTERVANRLIELKLDMLWVSMDGASPECYMDVRLGDALPRIIDNLKYLQVKKYRTFGASNWAGHPKLGIAFVAMKRNIHDLNEVIRLGSRLGAVEFSISNVLAHDHTLLDENLYMHSLDMVVGQEIRPLVHMPLMDIRPDTVDVLANMLKNMNRLELTGSLLNQNTDQCPFVERGSVAIRWDGMVSPCLPLLYTHTQFLDDRERTSREYFAGNIHEKNLLEIWKDENYLALRKRLQDFDFAPCAFCNSCEMANENMEDCFGNVQPTCGGCLWARGLIRCP
ncbi:MAG: SPASM domain-containing protein [Anaerolineales bacterium]|nr:MAG: SPASM domain-containing protein [Anaerolineales bacterium]